MDLEKWKEAKRRQKLTIADVAKRAGLPKGTVQNIFAGYVPAPRIDTVQAIEKALGLFPSLPSNGHKAGELYVFEEIGTVRAGFDGLIDEIPTGKKIELPASMVSGDRKDYFVLRVKGNSMYPRLLEGDSILCRRCDSVDSGRLAVVMYGGGEATVKKVVYEQAQDWLELVPCNPEYPMKRFEGADLEGCRVLGLVVWLIREM